MNYLAYLTDRREEMVEVLRTVVSYESPSREKEIPNALKGANLLPVGILG